MRMYMDSLGLNNSKVRRMLRNPNVFTRASICSGHSIIRAGCTAIDWAGVNPLIAYLSFDRKIHISAYALERGFCRYKALIVLHSPKGKGPEY